jgi:NAD(P)-dependent dehydrogenase (short-subunit alcohol dehydrogenase family)
MFSLHGRNAFITGGASGIGRAVAERFIAAGARVMIADLHDSAAAVARDIGAMFVRVDVGDEASVEAALAQAEVQQCKLHTVVNNAVDGDVGPSFEATPQAVVEKVRRINQFGVLYGLMHEP